MNMTAQQMQAWAFTDFDEWQKYQNNTVKEMDIVQQASMYAHDSEWHDRSSNEQYNYRNN